MEEFSRPYTEEELVDKFQLIGFDAFALQYCKDLFQEKVEYLLENDVCADEYDSLDEMIAELKKVSHWKYTTIREEAWDRTVSELRHYINQRKIGHGELWAREYASNAYLIDHFGRIAKEQTAEVTYRSLCYDYPDEAENEYEKEKEQLESYSKDYRDIYMRVYLDAKKSTDDSELADSISDAIATAYVNENLWLEESNLKKSFQLLWQRELIYKYFIKHREDCDDSFGTLFKNELRQALDLPPLDEPLTPLDQEYLDLKNKLIAKGLSEIKAERVAYKEVFDTQDDYTFERPMSKEEQLRREIMEMMYPNDDIDDEDFEDGFDLEDFYKD